MNEDEERRHPINRNLALFQWIVGTLCYVHLLFDLNAENGAEFFIYGLLFFCLLSPFHIVSFASFFKAKDHPRLRFTLLCVGVGLILLFPLIFLLFFDWELIFLELFGLFLLLPLTMWRKQREKQLLLLNIFGSLLTLLLILFTIVYFWKS